jgi:catechol 2,3-dioxygenase-like lactoylglutathione lyase family enzyme
MLCMRIVGSNPVLAVHDLDRSESWYSRVLGCERTDPDPGNRLALGPTRDGTALSRRTSIHARGVHLIIAMGARNVSASCGYLRALARHPNLLVRIGPYGLGAKCFEVSAEEVGLELR